MTLGLKNISDDSFSMTSYQTIREIYPTFQQNMTEGWNKEREYIRGDNNQTNSGIETFHDFGKSMGYWEPLSLFNS